MGSIDDMLFKVPQGFDKLDVPNVLEPLITFGNYMEGVRSKISSIKKKIESSRAESYGNAAAPTLKRLRRNASQTTEIDTDMPPPTLIPVKRTRNAKMEPSSPVSVKEERQSTRSKRTRGATSDRENELQFSNIRDSDVQIQSMRITVIDITDSEEDEQPIRSTRTRTRAKATERPAATRIKTRAYKAQQVLDSTHSESEEPVRSTRTQTRAGKNKTNDTVSSQSKDDVKGSKKDTTDALTFNDEAFVKENEVNETHWPSEEPEITDDESFEAPTKKFVTNIVTKDNSKKTVEQVFNLYNNSPIKKHFETFERLGGAGTPQQQETPTSTRAHSKRTPLEPIMTVNENSASKPASTARLRGDDNTSVMAKAASELKISQEEFRKREIQRRKKEEEAQQKNNVLLLQQMKEKKKKREERQMVATTTRAVLEKEKAEQLKKLKQAKEEKHKQLLAEKEEKLQKQIEELAQIWAPILKKQKQVPLYLSNDMPLLPTADCYDSDNEKAPKTIQKPDWQSRENLKLQWTTLGMRLPTKFWPLCPRTPNLREFFKNIPSPKLKRNSSCIWQSFNETASSSTADMSFLN